MPTTSRASTRAQRIVDAAHEAFGEIHVLVNNAGICRDRMFTSMTEADWDDVMRVHLRGHFCLAQLLAREWREASKAGPRWMRASSTRVRGRVCKARSARRTMARPRQPSRRLTLMQAAELQRYGVRVNALAPAARTSMTEGVFAEMMKKPADGFDYFDPANVAPLVVWLGSAAIARRDRPGVRSGGRHDRGRRRLAHGAAHRQGARWKSRRLGGAVAALVAQSASRRNRSTEADAMNLALSEEQTMIRDAAAEVLAERSASAAVRQAIEHCAGRDEALWRTLAGELGWCALTVPEASGGAGLGAMELVLLMEQMGRRLACVPYFSTVCLAATALAQCDSEAAREWLARIASGEVSATLALQAAAGFDARRLRCAPRPASVRARLRLTLRPALTRAWLRRALCPALMHVRLRFARKRRLRATVCQARWRRC